MARREKISAVDTAWLRMDRPGNLMMICGVMFFRGAGRFQAPARGDREALCCSSAASYQRPVQTPAAAFWEADRRLRLDHHVVHVALPGQGGKKELQALVSRLAATPLNPAHGRCGNSISSRTYDGGSALIARIHHCYADGIALVQVILSMTDVGAERSAGDARAARQEAARGETRTTCSATSRSRSPTR